METEELTLMELMKFGVNMEMIGKYRYRTERRRVASWGSEIRPLTEYHCCYPNCIARFLVEENGDRFRIVDNIAFHDHSAKIEPTFRNTISTFLSAEVDSLIKAGIPTQSVLRLAYDQLGIDINKYPLQIFAMKRRAIDMRRSRLGKHYRFADDEIQSLQIFTEIAHRRQPQDLLEFQADDNTISWVYSPKRAKQIAEKAEELFIDSTFKLTVRRVAFYAVVAKTEEGHGFPVCYIMIQPDTSEMLSNALIQFKNWSSPAKLQFIISDCAKQIEASISQVFGSSATHRWCSFHVLRAVAKSSKFFSLRPKFERFFNAFHELCCKEMDEIGVESQIQIIEEAIQIEPQAKKYYKEQWEEKKQLWIRGGLCNITFTNNFCEGHFRSLKYRYLGGRTNFRIDELVVLLITEVIPDMEIRLLNDQITAENQADITAGGLNDAEVGDDVLDTEFIDNIQSYCEKIVSCVRAGTLDKWTVNSTLRHLLQNQHQ